MTKDQVYNYILVNTNQYFVGSENFEINENVLDGLIWRALNIWGEYYPVYVVSPVTLNGKKTSIEKIKDEFGVERVIRSVVNMYVMDPQNIIDVSYKENLKVPFNWIYDDVRNVLITSVESGTYYLETFCTPILDDVNTTETAFLDLVTGLAMVYIGHNRTDFALSELPFDIKDISQEGQELINKVLEDLKEESDSNWYYAIKFM